MFNPANEFYSIQLVHELVLCVVGTVFLSPQVAAMFARLLANNSPQNLKTEAHFEAIPGFSWLLGSGNRCGKQKLPPGFILRGLGG